VAFDVMNVMESKLYSDGRPGEASRAALLAAVVTVAGVFVFVPRYGINGAAAVTSVAFIAQVGFLVARGGLHRGIDGPLVPSDHSLSTGRMP
jgi:O-antigen/teichoic acid export membrane protein